MPPPEGGLDCWFQVAEVGNEEPERSVLTPRREPVVMAPSSLLGLRLFYDTDLSFVHEYYAVKGEASGQLSFTWSTEKRSSTLKAQNRGVNNNDEKNDDNVKSTNKTDLNDYEYVRQMYQEMFYEDGGVAAFDEIFGVRLHSDQPTHPLYALELSSPLSFV